MLNTRVVFLSTVFQNAFNRLTCLNLSKETVSQNRDTSIHSRALNPAKSFDIQYCHLNTPRGFIKALLEERHRTMTACKNSPDLNNEFALQFGITQAISQRVLSLLSSRQSLTFAYIILKLSQSIHLWVLKFYALLISKLRTSKVAP